MWNSKNSFETLCLKTKQGFVHWPVYNTYEKDTILRCSFKHGLNLNSDIGEHTKISPQRGIVAALGKEAEDEAQLYAYLTFRNYQSIEHTFELLDIKELEVVITTPDHLSPELFDILQWVRLGFAPGLIFANKEDLRLRCMVCALSKHGPIQNQRYAEHFSDFMNPGVESESNITSKQFESVNLRQIISSDSGLLVLQTHCDGIDAFMSPQATLCARPDDNKSLESTLCGRCYQENWCHRLSAPLDEKLKNSFLTPKLIQSDIFLFDVCWGLLPPADVIHPKYGLGFALTKNLQISAMISTWRPILHSPNLIRPLISNIRHGISLGEAVGRHNITHQAQNLDHALCIFGDPATHLHASHEFEDKIIPMTVHTHSNNPISIIKNEYEKSIKMIQYFLKSPQLHDSDSKNLRIQHLQNLLNTKIPIPVSETNTIQDFQKNIMEFLCEIGPRFDSHWLYGAKIRYIRTSTHHCLSGVPPSERLVTFQLNLENSDLYRNMSLCQRCGVAEDVDPTLNVRVIACSPNTLKINELSKHLTTYATVIIKGQEKTNKHIFYWPKDNNGKLADTFVIPKLSFAGIIEISVVVMELLSFSVFSFMIPANQIA